MDDSPLSGTTSSTRRARPQLKLSLSDSGTATASPQSSSTPPSSPSLHGSGPPTPRFAPVPHRTSLREVLLRSKTRSRIAAVAGFTSASHTWAPERDVPELVAVLKKSFGDRTDADVSVVTKWLARNPTTRDLFTAVPPVLLTEILRQATLTVVDSDTDDLLIRQHSLQDVLYVILRGEGVCYKRDSTVTGGYTWNADEVALDEFGRLPVRCSCAVQLERCVCDGGLAVVP